MQAFTTVTQYYMEILSRAIRQENEMKDIQIRKKEIKPALFTDDTILGIENPKDFTRKYLELIKEFTKVAGYKSQQRNIISVSIQQQQTI